MDAPHSSLQPVSDPALEARVRASLDVVRPALQADGGDVELLGLALGPRGTVARVRLHGACRTCPAQPLTMKNGLEAQLKQDIPELAGLHLEDAPQPAKRSWNIY